MKIDVDDDDKDDSNGDRYFMFAHFVGIFTNSLRPSDAYIRQ